jgi:hypothetical protein
MKLNSQLRVMLRLKVCSMSSPVVLLLTFGPLNMLCMPGGSPPPVGDYSSKIES